MTDHPEKNGALLKKIWKSLNNCNFKGRIEIRLDSEKEFYKESVRNFCNKNNICIHFIPKGSPGLQAFIERGFRTIKEEFLNLIWIGDLNKFKDVLRDARYGYNRRPNSAFGYRNPLEVMAAKASILPHQVNGH